MEQNLCACAGWLICRRRKAETVPAGISRHRKEVMMVPGEVSQLNNLTEGNANMSGHFVLINAHHKKCFYTLSDSSVTELFMTVASIP